MFSVACNQKIRLGGNCGFQKRLIRGIYPHRGERPGNDVLSFHLYEFQKRCHGRGGESEARSVEHVGVLVEHPVVVHQYKLPPLSQIHQARGRTCGSQQT